MLTIWLRFNEVMRVFFDKYGLIGFGTIVTEDNLIDITSPINPFNTSDDYSRRQKHALNA